MRMLVLRSVVAMCVLLAGGHAWAQVPRTLSYQGVLADAAGNLVPDGNHTLTLTLYDAATAGSVVFTETQTVAVVRGVFNCILGSATSGGISPGVTFDRAYFLGVSVDSGTELTPRTPLTTSPYALRASIAETVAPDGVDTAALADLAVTGAKIAAGGVGTTQLADGAATAAKLASNAVTTTKILDGAVSTLKIADDAVTNAKIATGTIAPSKIATTGASSGQALVFNGSTLDYGNVSLTLPYSATVANASPLLSLTNSGAGSAMAATIASPGSIGTVFQATSNGIGSGISVQLTNASNGARGLDVMQSGVGPGVFATSQGGNAVWGITSSISAAGVIGDNTFGEAVVGRNRGTAGVGAVVGRNDDAGYGVRGFNTKDGIGVIGQAGISGGTGVAGHFENVNAANNNITLHARTVSTGVVLLVEQANIAPGGDLAIFKTATGNQVRIDASGKGFFNSGTQVGGADVAEAFETIDDAGAYEPGDVLVISTRRNRTVERSREPYSTRVAGVYATKPGVLLSERTIDAAHGDTVPMGVIGVIPTKVSGENGPIQRGDLLVTSTMPGHAMRAGAQPAAGTIIGKALEPFDGVGTGRINVLVSIR